MIYLVLISIVQLGFYGIVHDTVILLYINIVAVSGMVNLIRLWYSLMHRDLYDIWFLGSEVSGSQEPSGEWVNE